MQVAEKTALLRPVELKLVPVALEGAAFRTKFLDTDELLGYTSWIAVIFSFFCTFYSLIYCFVCLLSLLLFLFIMTTAQTFSGSIPMWLRKTPIARKMSTMLVNHLGLTLTREDLQNVVDLMEP